MHLTQRWINRSVFILFSIGSCLSVPAMLFGGAPRINVIVGTATAILITSLTAAYWRGWLYARHILVILVTLATNLSLQEPYLTGQISLATLVPPVLALLLTEPRWVAVTIATGVAIMLARAGLQSIYLEPIGLTIQILIYGGLLLSRLATDSAQHLERLNLRLLEANARIEQKSAANAQQAAELEQRSQEQQHLLDVIQSLETPTIMLAEGVLLAPVVGNLDSRRVHILTDRLLMSVSFQRARLVVLDIAGVTLVDGAVAEGLIQTVQAVRLLGCDVAITGISPAVALALTQQGVELSGVLTATSPQDALRQHTAQTAAAKPGLLRRPRGINN